MSWFNANEVFFMEAVVRDRVDDLRGSVDRGSYVDGELVEALRRGEPTAAEQFVARYADGAYRLANGIVGNAAAAEAVVEDAFSNAIETIDTLRGEAALGPWLYGIVADGALRRVGPARETTAIALADVLPVFHEENEQAMAIDDWSGRLDDPRIDVRTAMDSAIDELSPEDRALVILHDVEGLTMAEVANALDISIPDARTRVHHARLVLRKQLAAYMTNA